MQSNCTRAGTLLLAAALAACSDAPTGAAPESAETTLAQQVAALGFHTDMIEDRGDYVVVEGDIRLTKAQLRAAVPLGTGDPMGPRFQYRTNNLVTLGNVHDIRVNVSGLASQPGWQTAAREALTHWSGITGSHVRMVESGPADITVYTYCTSSNVAAQADFPTGGNTGPTVHVNTCFGYSTTHAQKVHNMVHEFGHTLGFRHSNYQQRGESASPDGAVHVSGTPTSGNDAGSVMNGGTALYSWAGLSSADVYATRSLYPAQLAASVSYPGGTPAVAWNAVNGTTSYKLYYVTDRYYVGPGTYERVEQVVNTTTGTSLSDPYRSYTGISMCEIRGTVQGGIEEQYGYRVEASWPGGTTYSAFIPAETGDC